MKKLLVKALNETIAKSPTIRVFAEKLFKLANLVNDMASAMGSIAENQVDQANAIAYLMKAHRVQVQNSDDESTLLPDVHSKKSVKSN